MLSWKDRHLDPLHGFRLPKTIPNYDAIAFVASDAPEAQDARRRLVHAYGNSPPKTADVIVALGGDGFMLETMHRYMNDRIPIYGMNRGSIGFLMNEFNEGGLVERLGSAEITRINPLAMVAHGADGTQSAALAINEVSLFRETRQAAKFRISIDGKVRLDELICDGLLVATPAGSTAYNLSAHGPILPIDAKLLALTAISPFRPRRWRGALVANQAKIRIDVLEAEKRPASAVADNAETRDVIRVDVELATKHELYMMFDPGHTLDERILSEQFRY
jgi:NAD+ kinase